MWNILIDTSGMPTNEDIYVGMFLINENYEKKFLTEFYTQFPQLRYYNKKSTKLKKETLLDTLRFLDKKSLKMVCYHFKKERWDLHINRINELNREINKNYNQRNNFPNLKEKILGILYYYAITYMSNKSCQHKVIVCPETHLDIFQVIDTIYKLARRDGWNLDIIPKHRKHHHPLKMADYVAGANRKNEEKDLNQINRHRILKDPIKDCDLKKVFKIWGKR